MSSTRARPRPQLVARIREFADSPGPRSETPALVITVGLPGSGKSTFTRRLAAETGAVILESDALRRHLFGEPSYSSEESSVLFAAIHEAATRFLADGRDVVIDATNLRRSDREPAFEIARETGARLVVLHFTAPDHVIEQRLQRRAAGDDPFDRSTAGIAVYRHMAEEAEPLTEEHWRIDTSDGAAADATLPALIDELRLGRKAGKSHLTGGTIS